MTPYSVLDSTKCPHKNRDIEQSAKYLKISVREVLDIMNNERPRRQSTAKLRSAERALRCGVLLSSAAGHRRALHGASLL